MKQPIDAAALEKWYSDHSLVRHLWAIDEAEAIRIILALEPTIDGGDTQPAWLANSSSWARELQVRSPKVVRLELLDEPSHLEEPLDPGCVMITEIAWRDPAHWPE